MNKSEIIRKLYSTGSIQFRKHHLQQNYFLPFKIDLSILLSEIELSKALSKLIWEKTRKFDFDLICGVPTLGALIAGFISWQVSFPSVAQKFDMKGTSQIIGKFKSGQRCIVIQDVLGFGNEIASLSETLESEGLRTIDSVSLIDLEIGGKKFLNNRGIFNHSVFKISEVFEDLYESNNIPGDKYKLSSDFLKSFKSKK